MVIMDDVPPIFRIPVALLVNTPEPKSSVDAVIVPELISAPPTDKRRGTFRVPALLRAPVTVKTVSEVITPELE